MEPIPIHLLLVIVPSSHVLSYRNGTRPAELEPESRLVPFVRCTSARQQGLICT